jgi:hypothetical protein
MVPSVSRVPLNTSLPGDTVAGLDLVDTHGHARRGYDLEGPVLVLVRPDGYLGLVTPGLGTERVEDYLALVLAPSLRREAGASG